MKQKNSLVANEKLAYMQERQNRMSNAEDDLIHLYGTCGNLQKYLEEAETRINCPLSGVTA